jgi:hypothetical protein
MPPQEPINLGAAQGTLLQGTRSDTSTLTCEEIKHVMKGGLSKD